METCYKVFRREIVQKIHIEENRFGFEPEITAKVARLRLPHLRGGDLVCGPHLRRRQEDRLERRRARHLVHPEVQPALEPPRGSARGGASQIVKQTCECPRVVRTSPGRKLYTPWSVRSRRPRSSSGCSRRVRGDCAGCFRQHDSRPYLPPQAARLNELLIEGLRLARLLFLGGAALALVTAVIRRYWPAEEDAVIGAAPAGA